MPRPNVENETNQTLIWVDLNSLNSVKIKQFSILYRGPKIWNSLPVSLISPPSIFVFKKYLKNYLTDSRSVA